LKEELADLGKKKLQESLGTQEPWPTINLNTNNVNPAIPSMRQSLMDKMGMQAPPAALPTTFAEKQNIYQDMLSQVANEMRQNPADLNNFRNV
jgi:hypothetical protein